LERASGGPVRRLRATAALERLAAVGGGAVDCVSSSLPAAANAPVFGRPCVLLNLLDAAKLAGFRVLTGLAAGVVRAPGETPAAADRALAEPAAPGVLAALQAGVDRHFDRIAELA